MYVYFVISYKVTLKVVTYYVLSYFCISLGLRIDYRH